MNYKGIIIEESLQDASLLKEVKILNTKVEPITPEHKTPWLKQWILHTVEIPEEKAQEIAEKISQSFDKAYGISIGIPEYQVDFAPEDKVW